MTTTGFMAALIDWALRIGFAVLVVVVVVNVTKRFRRKS